LRICRDHPAIGEEPRGVDTSGEDRKRKLRTVVACDEQGTIDSPADEVAPIARERYRVDRCAVRDRTQQPATRQLVDFHRVSAGDRGTVPRSGHRWECGREIALNLGHARELGEQLTVGRIPDAGRVVNAADGDEPPVWLEARDNTAVVANRW
jgi:hypothetical protein